MRAGARSASQRATDYRRMIQAANVAQAIDRPRRRSAGHLNSPQKPDAPAGLPRLSKRPCAENDHFFFVAGATTASLPGSPFSPFSPCAPGCPAGPGSPFGPSKHPASVSAATNELIKARDRLLFPLCCLGISISQTIRFTARPCQQSAGGGDRRGSPAIDLQTRCRHGGFSKLFADWAKCLI